MQRSTKVDDWSYQEDLTLTDEYPDPTGNLVTMGLLALSILFGIKYVQKYPSNEVPYYFRLREFGYI